MQVFLPIIHQRDDLIFQQDNGKIRTSNVMKSFFSPNNITTADHPLTNLTST
jgi:hypothetical protein